MSIAVADTEASSAAARERGALTYQPALDGLRAFAVAAVMLYHLGFPRTPGGFLGVDLFFVISGFLITTLLLQERRSAGRISLRGFWLRRARRLLPAALLLLLGVSLYAWLVADVTELGRIRGDAFASLLYVQNWRLVWSGQSYFEAFSAPSPLRHLWSLAIEEQFYLVWPLVLAGLLRLVGRRRWAIAAVVALATAASAAVMRSLHDPIADASRVYYGTDTRAHTLLAGVLLALAFDRAGRGTALRGRALTARWSRSVDAAGITGLAFLLWAVAGVGDTDAWLYERFGFLLVAVAAVGLVAASVQPRGVIRSLFAVPPLPWIGRLSYGLYLWHWPVYLVLTPQRVGWEGPTLDALRFATTFAIASASYHLVERPLRFGGWRAVRRAVLVPAVYGAVIVSVLVATAGARTAPAGIDLLTLENPMAFAPDFRAPDGRPRVLLVGDSVAFTLGLHAPRDRVPSFGLVTYGRIGCGVLRGDLFSDGRRHRVDRECAWWPDAWERFVTLRQPDLTLVMVGAWEVYDHVADGRVLRVSSPEFEQALRAELDLAVDILSRDGGRVAFFDVPCYREPERGLGDGALERNDPERVAIVNDVIADVARTRTEVVGVVPIGDLLCPGGRPLDRVDGHVVRYDGVHLSERGAHHAWEWLVPRVEALLPEGEPVSVVAWNAAHPDEPVEAVGPSASDVDAGPASGEGGDRLPK